MNDQYANHALKDRRATSAGEIVQFKQGYGSARSSYPTWTRRYGFSIPAIDHRAQAIEARQAIRPGAN
jgi:hypothetical protein